MLKRNLCPLVALATLSTCSVQAYDLTFGTNIPPVAVHGFASQGYLLNSDYNYLANDTKNGSFQFSEFGLNVSMNPFPRTRIAVQGFDFDLGNVGQYDPFLDYALIEYTVNDEVGIRAGRIRRPGGIYNAIQDIDVARTFVLLPQGIYDARWRDWSTSLDGGELFGNLPLQKLGSLSYEAYAGKITMQENGGTARWAANALGSSVDTMDDAPTFGGQLWYNTPVDGLRFGASVTYMENFGFSANSGTTVFGMPASVNSHVVGNVLFQQYSAEYLWRNWTFQAEYYMFDLNGYVHSQVYVPLITTTIQNLTSANVNPESWYAAVSYRLNKHAEVGAYYTMWHDLARGGYGFQNDAALCLRLNLTDWWTFKVEGHYVEGTALLQDRADNAHVDNNSGWFMLALKTTLSF